MRVLGIDPGTAVLGFGVVETGTGPHPRLLECGNLTTPPRDPLPSPDISRPPRTSMELLIARIWCDALAVDTVTIDDSFFDLGGHSLSAMQLV